MTPGQLTGRSRAGERGRGASEMSHGALIMEALGSLISAHCTLRDRISLAGHEYNPVLLLVEQVFQRPRFLPQGKIKVVLFMDFIACLHFFIGPVS